MKRGKRKISVCQFLLSGIQTGNRADSGKMSMFKACTHTPLFPTYKTGTLLVMTAALYCGRGFACSLPSTSYPSPRKAKQDEERMP